MGGSFGGLGRKVFFDAASAVRGLARRMIARNAIYGSMLSLPLVISGIGNALGDTCEDAAMASQIAALAGKELKTKYPDVNEGLAECISVALTGYKKTNNVLSTEADFKLCATIYCASSNNDNCDPATDEWVKFLYQILLVDQRYKALKCPVP
ncbi:MAG: hypothetical protein ACREDT_01380 [Methylocella sp.]